MDKILLNNQEFHFSQQDLPCLIHYVQGVGGSHFSVTMIADLFLSGSKVLFFTAYPMAKENFLKQVAGHENDILFVTQNNQITVEKKVLIIGSKDKNIFVNALNNLEDINERIIFVKNFEILDDNIVLSLAQIKKIIISGNLDSFFSKEKLFTQNFNTIIQFSKSDIITNTKCPDLGRYIGYFWQNNKDGLLKIVPNQGN